MKKISVVPMTTPTRNGLVNFRKKHLEKNPKAQFSTTDV